MERNREPRRASTAATNGLSRRRQRCTSFRDSPEEGGQMELQETVRLRDRVNRKDRDRELFCMEDSVDDEEEHDVEEDGRVARVAVMASNQNHRRSCVTMGKVGRQSPSSLKVTGEMIGVSVPRKARSGSAKRSSHEYCGIGGGGGVGEDQNHRQPSNSPIHRSGDANSPSTSNVSIRKKMKSIGSRNQPPKIAKSPTSVQDDIEIEIAEVLYGLMKQSQGSKMQESAGNSPQERDSNGSKRRKLEAVDGFTSTRVQCGSTSSVIKVETEQSAKTEDSTAKSEKISESRVKLCDAASDLGASQSAPVLLDSQKDASAEVKSSLCLKSDADLADSTMAKANSIASEVHNQREEKFEIDLMALPPLEKDGSTDSKFDPKLIPNAAEMKMEIIMKNEKKVEKIVKKELMLEGFGEKKLETNDEQCDVVRFDSEKHFHGNVCKLQQAEKQQQQPITVPKAQSSSPFPIIVPGWPDSHPPGYVPPIQRMASIGESSAFSAPMQHPHFVLSQPRPKRCTTHHYIAHNIYCHQQLTKMNPIRHTTARSASPYGAKPYNLNVNHPAEGRVLGNPLKVSGLGGNLISKGGAGKTAFPGHSGKENSSEVTNFMDTAQRKQLVLQQAPQPVPAGNLLMQHRPAFIFPMNQHQSAVAAKSKQSGTPKSATSKNGSLSSSSAAGASSSSSRLPAVAAAMSFNNPNFAGNEAQYMAVLQNNGYSFPISTQVGTQSPVMGGTHAQAMPFFTGSFHSSQMFHPQIKQQQLYTQPWTQPAHQVASASSGSSSHKQLQSQQQRGSQINGNNFFTSTNMQFQQSHKQHVPSSHPSAKLEAEISEDTSTLTDSRALHSQKSLYGQNFAVPAQQLNFALLPSTILGGGNHSEKQQQPQNSKGGVEFIPSQAFALSYPSYNGSSTAKGINFSSAAQSPAIFQSMTEMARYGFMVPSEGKGGGEKNSGDDEKTAIRRKSPTSFGQSSLAFSKPTSTELPASTIIGNTIFDSSAKASKFISSANLPHSVTSNSITSTAAAAVNSPNSQLQQQQQQQQLVQLQKQQQMMQQHLQQQHAMTSRSKAPTTNSQPSTPIAANFPNNASVFSQTFLQSKTSAQSNQWKNSARTPVSQGTSLSLSACTTSILKNFPQEQGRVLQGHTQISFGETHAKSVTSQAQTILSSNESSSLLAGVPCNSSVSKNAGGSIRTASPVTHTLQSQQTENSTTSPCQKSSPVCGRNVPSIISTCPSQISELKH